MVSIFNYFLKFLILLNIIEILAIKMNQNKVLKIVSISMTIIQIKLK